MNKDDLEFFRRLKSLQPTALNSLDLLKGIETRELGLNKKNAIKGDLELFAEEQLIRKNDFDEMVSDKYCKDGWPTCLKNVHRFMNFFR